MDTAEHGKEMLKILIVFPSDTERCMLKSVFNEQNSDVAVAENIEDGLRLSRVLRPDIIVADCSMRSDGAELCKQVRQDPELGAIPFVLVSSFPNALNSCHMRHFEAGCDQVVYKPFKLKELGAAIESALKRPVKENLIPVLYRSGVFALESPESLGQLIAERKIICFRRQDAVAVVGRDPVRKSSPSNFLGQERRRSP